MSDLIFLWLANIFVWMGICGYLIFLGRSGKRINERLQQLEIEEYDSEEFD